MFDSSMSAAAIAARVQELQAAAGIKAQLVRTSCSSDLCTVILTHLYAVHLLICMPMSCSARKTAVCKKIDIFLCHRQQHATQSRFRVKWVPVSTFSM